MKIMKKIAAAALASAALFAFVGCSGDDDPNDMISGSAKKYSISYTNEDSVVSRGYKDTAYAHAGAAVEVTFQNVSADTAKAGVMGLIFDLNTEGDKRSFDVIGLRATGIDGGIDYYVSRFENVEDIHDDNFGAWQKEDGEKGPATETKYVDAFKTGTGKYDAEKKTTTVYAYAIEKKADVDGKDSAKKTYKKDEFIYQVYLLNNKIAKLDSDGNLVDEEGHAVDLSGETPVATIATGYKRLTQNKLAVYANVYPTEENIADKKKTSGCGTLEGTWTYRGDYKEVGVDED